MKRCTLKNACVDAVSRSETERESGVKQIGLVGARAVCGSDSRSAVSRGNQTGLCGSLFRQSTQQQRILATWPFTGESPLTQLSTATVREASQLERLKIHRLMDLCQN